MKGTKLNGTRYAPGHMSKSRQAQIGEEAHSERGTTLGNGVWRPENCQAAGRHNEAYPGIYRRKREETRRHAEARSEKPNCTSQGGYARGYAPAPEWWQKPMEEHEEAYEAARWCYDLSMT